MVAARALPVARDFAWNPHKEAGHSGLNALGGTIYEEFHKDLRGPKGVKAFREMADNCSAAGSFLWLLEALISQVKWKFRPQEDNDSADHIEAADFAESCRQDLSPEAGCLTWADTISEIGPGMATFGWSLNETWYKQRRGTNPQGDFEDEYERARHVSKFDDGRLGWGGIEPRPPESLDRWILDRSGRPVAMAQRTSFGATAVIPLSKALLFRARSRKNNPEGYSLLRPGYVDWYHLREIRIFEGIGVERDLAGLPVMQVPRAMTLAEPGTREYTEYLNFQKMTCRVRRNQLEGLTIPAEEEQDGKTGFKFGLLASGGARQHNTSEIIKRYESRILMSLLAEFILLGTDKVGSFALGDIKMDVLAYAAYAFLHKICEVINGVAIPRLMRLNGYNDPRIWPVLRHSPIATPDLTHIANYLSQLVAQKILTPGPEIERWVRERADLPPGAPGAISVDESLQDAPPEERRAA